MSGDATRVLEWLEAPDRAAAAKEVAARHDELRRFNFRHWPAGSPGSIGGQFAPRGTGSSFGATGSYFDEGRAQIEPAAYHPAAAGPAQATDGPPPDSAVNEPPRVPASLQTDVPQSEANAFYQKVMALPGATPALAYILTETFIFEGGMNVNARNGATGGITGTFLRQAQNETVDPNHQILRFPDLAGVSAPARLSLGQMAEVYQYLADNRFDTVGGHTVLDRIGDRGAAASLFDTFFWAGSTGGAKIVQRAINDTLKHRPGAVPIDSRMGPRTLDAYIALARNPATRRALLDNLARERGTWGNNHSHRIGQSRLDYFRFLDKSTPAH